MGSELFWQRWWKILWHQRIVWVFMLIGNLPKLLLALLATPLFLALPPLVAPPEVWDHWLQEQREGMMGASLALLCVVLLAGLAAWILNLWSQAGIITTVRRAWGREETPLSWDEAHRGLKGPTLRLLLVQLVVMFGTLIVSLPLFGVGMAAVAWAAGSADDPNTLFIVLAAGFCLVLPIGLIVFALAPWLWAAKIAAAAEYPASWSETWHTFKQVARRGWPAFYAMLILYVGLAAALGVVKQGIQMPLFMLTMTFSNREIWAEILVAVTSGTLQVVIQAVSQTIGLIGWAVLYLHYRNEADSFANVTTPPTVTDQDDDTYWPEETASREEPPTLPGEEPPASPSF